MACPSPSAGRHTGHRLCRPPHQRDDRRLLFDRPYSGEEYLAAASLSDMVVNILIVPPLAFNQVLNALVGQALGSDNKKMAV